MRRYLFLSLSARIRRGKTLFLLSLLGVAVGVASVTSIQIINRNSLSAFRGSMKAVSGDADLTVTGRGPYLDETVLPRVLAAPGVAGARPVFRVHVAVEESQNLFLEAVGTDLWNPIGLPPTGSGGENPDSDRDPSRVLAVDGWTAITPALAAEHGWETGDTLSVSSGADRVSLVIGALVDFQRYSPLASRKLALMDISQAQDLFGRRGEITEIHVTLAPGADRSRVERELAGSLGPAFRVETPEAREAKVEGLLGAFRLNLTALSLISLFVGLFLIYSSIQTGLVRRRTEFGLLRSVGATRNQVLALMLGDVALLGALGTALGIPLGYLAASLGVGPVNATITSIYLLSEIERMEIPLSVYLLAAAVGVGGALAGGLIPALDMSRRDTRSLLVAFTLRERISGLAPRLALAGGLLAAAVFAWFLTLGAQVQSRGFVLGFALLVVIPLLTPGVLVLAARRVRPRGLDLRYSLRTLVLKLQTTAFSVAALAVAVSMLVGVTLLIGSFRKTLETWMERSIRADVYITTESWAREGRLATLTPEVMEKLEHDPGVASVEYLRQFQVDAGERTITLSGVRFAFGVENRFDLALYRGNPEGVKRGLEAGGVLIGEPLSRKTGLGLGDSLRVSGSGITHAFAVIGVSYDYSEAGNALISLAAMNRVFGPGPVNNAALFLEPSADAGEAVDRLRGEFRDLPLIIRSNQELRAEVLHLFDQTFAITRILQVMALCVAAAGVSLTLLILARERVAELALYRALGALRSQIFRVFLGEGLAIGGFGLGLGLAGGIGLAAVLIYVINPAYFGWTIRPAWPWGEILQETITILAVAGAASIYPALRASRVPVRELTRDDL